MSHKIDQLVASIQDQIFKEARETYGDMGFERWRNPLYRGAMKDADGHGCLTGTCGDTMEIFLNFNHETR